MTHGLASMLKQRVFGLCLGYEDLNDHAELRCDVLLKTAAERDAPLAPPRPCRLENPRAYLVYHGSIRAMRRSRAILATCASASRNSVAGSCSSRVANCWMMPARSSPLTATMNGNPNFAL